MSPRVIARAAAVALVALSLGPTAAATGTAARWTLVSDVEYANAGGQPLRMDIFLPADGSTHPGVLLVHGGGFVQGDKALMRPMGLFLAENGYVAFSINYRLGPANPYPAAVDDAARAIEFMRENAAKYHIDPRRIGALGGSAGGTIVSSLATLTGRGGSGCQVAAAVSWSGVLDMFRMVQEVPQVAGQIVDNYVYGEAGGPLDRETAQLRAASPISHVTHDDPPMFVANSADEIIPYDQATSMVQRLKAANVPAQLFTASGGHSIVYQLEARGPSLDFLNRYVRDYRGVGSGTCPGTGSIASSGGGGSSDLAVPILGGAAALAIVSILVIVARRRRPRAGP